MQRMYLSVALRYSASVTTPSPSAQACAAFSAATAAVSLAAVSRDATAFPF
jgi:hypothetical protein